MTVVVDDLDARGLADALVANRAGLVAAEARELAYAARWADLHPAEALEPRTVLPGMERARRFGGPGTPEAGEFAAAELAVLLGLSLAAAAALVADALDLRHRLPQLWAAVLAGRVRVWQARHVAKRTRATGLSLAQARAVDATTTPYLGSLPFGRFTDLLEARIIAADPAAAEARREAAELDRFVVTGQSTEHGLKTLIARAGAGEVIYLVAVIDRIADHLLHHGDTRPIGVRRATALGMLAHPKRVLALLGEPTQASGPSSEPSAEQTQASEPPAVERPPATLYVHLSRDAMATGQGVARMEDTGPITLGQAAQFLRHSHVTITPVLDLAEDRPVDCYETPPRLREQLTLRQPASVFPWSPATSRRMDLDHTTGWTPGTNATRIGNLGRLTRTEHRIKTHAPGWQHRQPQPGVHHWRTPTGHHYLVDHTGTHPLDPPTRASESPYEHAFAVLVGAG